jgi:Uma2 family endonuclease
LLFCQCVSPKSYIGADGYVEGAPELVAEIAASTASIDLGDKLRAYRRNGVKEYLVWQVFDERIDWFYLQDDDYTQLESDPAGILRSQIFPGLWLARQAMIVGDMQRVMAVLQAGLAHSDHPAFVAALTSSE